jgi:hypothetical protein
MPALDKISRNPVDVSNAFMVLFFMQELREEE